MSNPRSANAAASVREQKLARVIDREVAPIWHDRFARMLMRELPNRTGTFVLDVHSGPGHTTADLLQRLDETSRVVALGRDPWLMQIAKTHVKAEWKRRVYFKAGDIDDVTEMADATYDLSVANLVLGEHVVDWKAALAELRRVTKPGGHVLATVPLFGTWDEVEDMFEELLRDEGMTSEVATLQKLRRRRPKPEHIAKGLQELGFRDADWVLEHERFELLFRSGREFLFAPVIEHGPLRLWKAILGRAEQPQALFWRFKEVIDTYYAGKVLAVTVVAGLIRLRVPGPGVTGNFSAGYWSRYPGLAKLWNTSVENPTAKPGKQAKQAEEFVDLDLELDFGDDDDDDDEDESASSRSSAGASASASTSTSSESGLLSPGASAELPAVTDAALDDDPFANLLDDLDAADDGVAPLEPEFAEPERTNTGRVATLGTIPADESGVRPLAGSASRPPPEGDRPLPSKPSGSGATPLPSKPSGSGATPLPVKPAVSAKPPVTTGSVSAPAPKLQQPVRAAPEPPTTTSVVAPAPKPPTTTSVVAPAPKPPTTTSVVAPAPKPPTTTSVVGPAPKPPVKPPTTTSVVGPAPKPPTTTSVVAPAPKPPTTTSVVGPAPKPPTATAKVPVVGKPPVAAPVVAAAEPEPDPLASLLDDDVFDKVDDLDDLDDLDEIDDDEDFAASFGRIEPEPDAGRSDSRKMPPPLPPAKKS